MTVTDEQPGLEPRVVRDDSPTLPPRAEAVVRRRRIESRQRRITRMQAGVTILFVVLLAALVWLGYRATLEVGGGSDSRVTDPTAPGYLATPVHTIVDSYVVTDDDGGYVTSLLVVPDSSGSGGTVVPLASIMVLPEPETFLRDVYDAEGLEGFRSRLGDTLGFSIGSVREVPVEAMVDLADGLPIEVENPDPLIVPGEEGGDVRYPSGTLSIPPEGLAEFMAFEGADDPAPNQQIRLSQVWEELFARAEGRDHDGLPEGEATEGAESPVFGEMVDQLAAGDVRFDSVPLYRQPLPGSIIVVAWMVDPQYIDGFVSKVVPLPTSPSPGRRPSVAVLNGSSDPDAVSAAVPKVVSGGGEVSVVGNAMSFDVDTTTVEYLYPEEAEAAERIAEQLGVEATEGSPPDNPDLDGVSVVVTLGSDLAP